MRFVLLSLSAGAVLDAFDDAELTFEFELWVWWLLLLLLLFAVALLFALLLLLVVLLLLLLLLAAVVLDDNDPFWCAIAVPSIFVSEYFIFVLKKVDDVVIVAAVFQYFQVAVAQ